MAPINATSINVHNRTHELVPGLLIAGLGGSMPTQFRKEGQNEFVDVFNPYPYKTEADFTTAIE